MFWLFFCVVTFLRKSYYCESLFDMKEVFFFFVFVLFVRVVNGSNQLEGWLSSLVYIKKTYMKLILLFILGFVCFCKFIKFLAVKWKSIPHWASVEFLEIIEGWVIADFVYVICCSLLFLNFKEVFFKRFTSFVDTR